MKTKHVLVLAALLLSTLIYQPSTSFAQGTAFTYQGRLNDGSVPANGTYDLQFTLFNVSSGAGTVAGPLTNAATAISNGLFTVALDFGANFPGADRWLEISARTNGVGVFTTLSPRQKITAVPYAIMANSASNLLGMLPASQLSGTLPSSQLGGPYSGAVTLSNAANSFSGSGTSLTALNAGNISSGTLNDARLSGNVALLNANQTFTGVNTFNNSASSFTGSFTGNAVGLTNVNLLTAIPAGAIILTTNYSVGTFGFTPASGPVVGDGPVSVVAADVNGDGKVDLISANFNDDTLTVLTNNGSGGFVFRSSLSVGSEPESVAAADVNGDGKVDLISANYFSDTLSVRTNNGSGGFVLSSSPGVGSGPTSVAAADVNGDLKVDLICANEFDKTLTVLTNNGSGGFVIRSSPSVGKSPSSVAAADVNGDFAVDLISANSGTNTLTVLLNNGFGGFVSNSLVVGTGPRSVVAADVNGDLKVDLISANYNANTLTVLTNNGAGSFGSNATLTVGAFPRSVVAADVNGDFKVDLISASLGNDTLAVLTNNGSGGFVLAFSPAVGNSPESVAAADVNGDGTMDLISANFGDDTLTVLFNTLSLSNMTTTATIQGNFIGPTLTIQGDLTSGRVLLDPGSASLPGFAFVGDENTGIFHPAANTVAIATAGVERMRVTPTGGVGIGTTAPEGLLHVADGSAGAVTANANSIAVLEKSGDGYLSLLSPAANATGILFGNPNNNTDGGIIYNVGATHGMQFRTGTNSTKMTILADGNVGIGTTSPTNKLHVIGGVSATAFVTTSDRSAKENFAAVSPGDVLAKVAALPISTWNFKEMRDGRHMGPMAQDFYAAFGLGGSDTTITTVDPDGVALAAIQGLNQKLEETRAENAELKQRLEKLEQLMNEKNRGSK